MPSLQQQATGDQPTGSAEAIAALATEEQATALRAAAQARSQDHWVWTAHYSDGTTLSEYAEDVDHGFYEIDLTRLAAFELDPVDPASGRHAYCVLIDPEKFQRPIFFRRRATAWANGGSGAETVSTCIGIQETVWGAYCRVCQALAGRPCKEGCKNQGRRSTNVSTYVFFDDQGHVLIADNPNPLD